MNTHAYITHASYSIFNNALQKAQSTEVLNPRKCIACKRQKNGKKQKNLAYAWSLAELYAEQIFT